MVAVVIIWRLTQCPGKLKVTSVLCPTACGSPICIAARIFGGASHLEVVGSLGVIWDMVMEGK